MQEELMRDEKQEEEKKKERMKMKMKETDEENKVSEEEKAKATRLEEERKRKEKIREIPAELLQKLKKTLIQIFRTDWHCQELSRHFWTKPTFKTTVERRIHKGVQASAHRH
jgi:hypothetical protein